MTENDQDWADRIGKQVSTVFIAALAVMFAYGYLSHLALGWGA